jgi:hypothetical protein
MKSGGRIAALVSKLLLGTAFLAWAAYVLYHYTAQFRPIGRVIKTRWFS